MYDYDLTDTATFEAAVEMLTRYALEWTCKACPASGHVDGGPHGGAAEAGNDLESEAAIVNDAGAPAWEFACPACGTLLLSDEEGTR